jgi:hypothetical protein
LLTQRAQGTRFAAAALDDSAVPVIKGISDMIVWRRAFTIAALEAELEASCN